jgi:hypothetical protein
VPDRYEFTKDEIEKLPKWAREKVAVLNMRVREARAFAERREANKPTRMWSGRPPLQEGELDRRVFLNPKEYVAIKMSDDPREHRDVFELRLHEDRDVLQVMSNSSGELAVFPNSSNVVELRLIKRL